MTEGEQTRGGWWSGRAVRAVVAGLGSAVATVAVGWALLALPALTEALGLGMELGLAAAAGLVGMYAGATLADAARGDDSSGPAPGFTVRPVLIPVAGSRSVDPAAPDLGPTDRGFRDRILAGRAATAEAETGGPSPHR